MSDALSSVMRSILNSILKKKEQSMSYTKREGRFLSADGVTEVYYAIYLPEGNPKAVVQISHGMYEYIGRYEREGTVEALTQAGVVVCGNDHLGHGYTAKDEQDLGHVENYRYWVEDLHTTNQIVRKTYRRLPYILLGHSMGSFVARDYMVSYQDIDGVILSGTSSGNQPLGLGIALAGMIGALRGGHHHSPFLKRLSLRGYNKAFASEQDEHSWLSSDPAVRNRYAHDPFSTFAMTCQGYREVFRLLAAVSDETWASKVPLSLPVLLISGDADIVGENGEGVREVYGRLEDMELNELRLKLYPKGRHELLNDIDRDTVIADLLAWIDEVI
ncbi:MAG: alpha/beta hydrolase, partial [Ruminococcaceae bacterium]|nr:alpha/beta hydrolase [Oscillospiraceae bacterium]